MHSATTDMDIQLVTTAAVFASSLAGIRTALAQLRSRVS